jgi:hypothetical protein
MQQNALSLCAHKKTVLADELVAQILLLRNNGYNTSNPIQTEKNKSGITLEDKKKNSASYKLQDRN